MHYLSKLLNINSFFFFFFNDTATTEIYTLSLHDALPIRPWIAQLTRRLCLDRLRGAGREATAELDELEPGAIDETLALLDEALTVRAGLEAVGEPCREMLDRFFCRDESYKTIGEALDLPSGTISSRISRCLGKLRSELEGRL